MADADVFKKPCLGGCGMDLYWNQLPGTERDESKRSDFCPDCQGALPPTCVSISALVGVGRRIREALEIDGDGVPTALVWVRPDVAEKLAVAGLVVRVTPPGETA